MTDLTRLLRCGSAFRWLSASLRIAVACCVLAFGLPAATAAQESIGRADEQLPSVTPGELHTISIAIPSGDRPPGTVRYQVEPSAGVVLVGRRNGTLSWPVPADRVPAIDVRLLVQQRQASGAIVAARLTLHWSDGSTESIDARVNVTPSLTVTSAKDIEAEIVTVPRAAAPGGIVKLLYTIFSYEDSDERVRLRVDAGPGWHVLDAEHAQREMLLEAWEENEGELYLQLRDDARIGDRQLVRLLLEVVGEPGEIEAQNYVSVVRRGGAKPGVPTITGSSTLGLSQLGVVGLNGARRGGALTLTSKLGSSGSFSFSYDQGLRQSLSNFRYEEARTRTSGNVRYAGWDVSFGNYVSAQGNAITGPYVRGRGVSVQRSAGHLIGELVVSQPNTIGAGAAGHLIRGRAGVRTNAVTLAITASDFGRPAGGYTTLSSIQTTVLDADTQEAFDFQRRLTESAASNRVRGIGADTEFRPSRAHRLTLRTGGVWLSNAAGARVSAPVGEAAYALATRPGNLNVRWRDAPATVSGISIPGDELSTDGSLRLSDDLRVVGRAYRNSTRTAESDLFSHGEGGSAGIRFMRGARRIEVRATYRESQYTTRSLRRTVSVLGGTRLGPLSLNGNADVGEQRTATRVSRIAFYRGDLRWVRDGGTVSASTTHSDASGHNRQRFDVLASVKLGRTELAGGAWATRGYTSGGRPGVWTSFGVPVGFDSVLTVGVDYSPLTWTAQPSLRGMLSIQKRFSVPMPFVRPSFDPMTMGIVLPTESEHPAPHS